MPLPCHAHQATGAKVGSFWRRFSSKIWRSYRRMARVLVNLRRQEDILIQEIPLPVPSHEPLRSTRKDSNGKTTKRLSHNST